MKDENEEGPALKVFVGSFDFTNVETEEEGSFSLVVQGRDVGEATSAWLALLDDLAKTTTSLGPVLVYANTILEVGQVGLSKGLLFDHRTLADDVALRHFIRAQGDNGSHEHFIDLDGEEPDKEPDENADSLRDVPVFWSGVEAYRAKWKLFWCETDDHDEDWFVIARDEDDAAQIHVDAEGYDEDEATAEPVCVIPAAAQELAQTTGGGWPTDELLLACGAEFLPNVPQDGQNELRRKMDSGARVVRINGRVFAEGDVVGNTAQRQGTVKGS